ncbi:MAG: hypothetical protein ABID09_08055 [Candidatus Omnitrophota bacterium]
MMGKDRCLTCSEYRNCKDSVASWIFFIVGLIATIALRVVTVLIHVNPIYGKVAWYVGVTGFFAFFIYKYNIIQNRARTIKEHNLLNRVNNREELKEEDYRLISALLCGISSKKERINYIFIFGLSAVALLLAIYMDFLKN